MKTGLVLENIYNVDGTVEGEKITLLYNLLGERTADINISHKELPSMKEHIRFVMSKPYKEWYTLNSGGDRIGAAYISKNDEIGLFILKKHQGLGYGSDALQCLFLVHQQRPLFANINPNNGKSLHLFTKYGFRYACTGYGEDGKAIELVYALHCPADQGASIVHSNESPQRSTVLPA